MVRAYIAADGAHCPFCNSPEIESGRPESEAERAWAQVTCHDCGREWQDIFFLGAIDLIAADGSRTTVAPEPPL